MNYTVLPIQQLDTFGRKSLASLHQAVMKTLLSDLGIAIIERYYQVAVEDKRVIGFYAIQEKNLLGWVIGSPYPEMLNKRIRSPFFWFAMQMLRLLLFRPRSFYQLIISVRSTENEFKLEPGEIELTYIGVTPEMRGQKLGQTLLQTFLETSHASGYQCVSLSVEIENQTAISFYQGNGFQVTKTFTEGIYRRHRMVLTF